jgi:hypothetical protein
MKRGVANTWLAHPWYAKGADARPSPFFNDGRVSPACPDVGCVAAVRADGADGADGVRLCAQSCLARLGMPILF